jgi:hypothetical protein
MLQFIIGLVLVGLVLAYGLRWTWKSSGRLDPKGKAFVVTGAASGFGKEGSPLCPARLHYFSNVRGEAVTRILAVQGGHVFAVDINEELLMSEWKGKPNVHPIWCPRRPPLESM